MYPTLIVSVYWAVALSAVAGGNGLERPLTAWWCIKVTIHFVPATVHFAFAPPASLTIVRVV